MNSTGFQHVYRKGEYRFVPRVDSMHRFFIEGPAGVRGTQPQRIETAMVMAYGSRTVAPYCTDRNRKVRFLCGRA